MAEFCLECFNKIFDENISEEEAVLTKEYDLCEGCGEYKKTVIKIKKKNLFKFIKKKK